MSVPYITLAAPYTPLDNATFIISHGTVAKTRTYVSGSSQGRVMVYAACSLPINAPVSRPGSTENMLNAHPVKMGCYENSSHDKYRICCVTLTTEGQDSFSSYGFYSTTATTPSDSEPSLETNFMSAFRVVNGVKVAWTGYVDVWKSQDGRSYIETPNGELTIYPNVDAMIEAMLDGNWSPYQPPEPPTTNDPYAPGGTSQPGGGGGSFGGNTNPASTDVTNNIDIPPLPPAAVSAVNTGFITLFTPTTAELKNLADYMWSTSLFNLDTWQKLFANPMDALIGLSIVPVAVPSSGQSAVTVGNISTGVSMTKASSQYVSVNCGSIDFTEFWKGYLDYNPYTKVEIYLPYIGTRPISADDVMGKTVTVQYNIDVLSGACAAYIKCGDSVLYNFVGQCSCSIPISGGDMTQVINGTLSIAASIGAMAETGGMAAAAVGATLSTAANTIKTTVEKSGCISGMGGMLGIQTPYVIITRPRQALPENQNKFTGYPAFITATVGASVGYTEVEKVHLENIPATSSELAEIENLLKGGVIV